MSRSKHRAKCRHSCKMCTAERHHKTQAKNARQLPATDPPGGPLSPETRALIKAGLDDIREGRTRRFTHAELDALAAAEAEDVRWLRAPLTQDELDAIAVADAEAEDVR